MSPDKYSAEGVLESLRLGLPPSNFGRMFTVGRDVELSEIDRVFGNNDAHARLIQGNYGEGKSHMLEIIGEIAKQKDYLVADVTLDSRNGIRFNRMDQIATSVCRNITFAGAAEPGIGSVFQRFIESNEKSSIYQLTSSSLRLGVSNWANSAPLSPKRNIIRDAFYVPRASGWINWSEKNYSQSWNMLNDLENVAVLSGFKGFVLLFDEFEDVITNLNNRTWQERAFENFFRFTNPEQFVGKVFFGVTPEFSRKTIQLMSSKYFGNINEAKGQLDNIPKFRLKPLTLSDYQILADRVCEFHALAYEWDAIRLAREGGLDKQAELAFHARGMTSTRLIVQSMVDWLDALYEEQATRA